MQVADPARSERSVKWATTPRVARARGVGAPLTGAITFVQRFGGLVNLNVHYHLLVPDGVFAEAGDGLAFVLLPVPTGADLLAILGSQHGLRFPSRTMARRGAERPHE